VPIKGGRVFRSNPFSKICFAAVIGLLLLPGTGPAIAAAVSPTPLELRMQRLEDQKAIERLLLEYGRTLDHRDFAAYSQLFSLEGEWKGALGTFRGPAAIKAAMEKSFTSAAALADIPKGSNFHVMSNFIIDVQGDRASARSMFIFYKIEKSTPNAVVAGRYEDLLIRENGVWRFLQRAALPPL
jgi:3-phenylpropionate/cinnamic acid dioxygenase small subunit